MIDRGQIAESIEIQYRRQSLTITPIVVPIIIFKF
jgi:hypothetical protein